MSHERVLPPRSSRVKFLRPFPPALHLHPILPSPNDLVPGHCAQATNLCTCVPFFQRGVVRRTDTQTHIHAARPLTSAASPRSTTVSPSQDNAEDTLQINFNISFPHLSCEYASVDATNFMGTHDAGLASRVSKVMLDKSGNQIGPFVERKKPVKHTEDMPPLEHKELDRSLKVNILDFETVRRQYEVLIVNFHTPWCHWCQKLEPVWDQAAGTMVKEDNDQGLIRLASVDCSGDMGNKLCSQYRVDAFPTIMVFRRSPQTLRHKLAPRISLTLCPQSWFSSAYWRPGTLAGTDLGGSEAGHLMRVIFLNYAAL